MILKCSEDIYLMDDFFYLYIKSIQIIYQIIHFKLAIINQSEMSQSSKVQSPYKFSPPQDPMKLSSQQLPHSEFKVFTEAERGLMIGFLECLDIFCERSLLNELRMTETEILRHSSMRFALFYSTHTWKSSILKPLLIEKVFKNIKNFPFHHPICLSLLQLIDQYIQNSQETIKDHISSFSQILVKFQADFISQMLSSNDLSEQSIKVFKIIQKLLHFQITCQNSSQIFQSLLPLLCSKNIRIFKNYCIVLSKILKKINLNKQTVANLNPIQLIVRNLSRPQIIQFDNQRMAQIISVVRESYQIWQIYQQYQKDEYLFMKSLHNFQNGKNSSEIKNINTYLIYLTNLQDLMPAKHIIYSLGKIFSKCQKAQLTKQLIIKIIRLIQRNITFIDNQDDSIKMIQFLIKNYRVQSLQVLEKITVFLNKKGFFTMKMTIAMIEAFRNYLKKDKYEIQIAIVILEVIIQTFIFSNIDQTFNQKVKIFCLLSQQWLFHFYLYKQYQRVYEWLYRFMEVLKKLQQNQKEKAKFVFQIITIGGLKLFSMSFKQKSDFQQNDLLFRYLHSSTSIDQRQVIDYLQSIFSGILEAFSQLNVALQLQEKLFCSFNIIMSYYFQKQPELMQAFQCYVQKLLCQIPLFQQYLQSQTVQTQQLQKIDIQFANLCRLISIAYIGRQQMFEKALKFGRQFMASIRLDRQKITKCKFLPFFLLNYLQKLNFKHYRVLLNDILDVIIKISTFQSITSWVPIIDPIIRMINKEAQGKDLKQTINTKITMHYLFRSLIPISLTRIITEALYLAFASKKQSNIANTILNINTLQLSDCDQLEPEKLSEISQMFEKLSDSMFCHHDS